MIHSFHGSNIRKVTQFRMEFVPIEFEQTYDMIDNKKKCPELPAVRNYPDLQ